MAKPTRNDQSARDALSRLTLLGWSGGLASIALGLVVSFAAFGLFVVYWRNADMDLVVVYNALRVNAGLGQSYFDHPGIITIQSLALWYRALHAIGLLGIESFNQLPGAAQADAFAAAMTTLVRAGRIYSLIVGAALLAAIAFAFRRIVQDWRIALLGVFAIAFSGGFADHVRILRTELISAGAVFLALLVLILAARASWRWRAFALAAASALCMIGLFNKVQAIVPIAALPLLVLPFGPAGLRRSSQTPESPPAGVAIAALLIAALAFVAIVPLLRIGFDPISAASVGVVPVIAGRFGLYQPVLAAWVLVMIITYARLWRIGLIETLVAMGAVAAGGAGALALLYLDGGIVNLVAIVNPLEKMWSFATYAMAKNASPSSYALTGLAVDALNVLARYTFVLHSSPRPAVVLTWLILPGIVVAWRRGERQAALQALFLFGAAWAIDTLGVRRGLKLEYFIYTDPLLVLAGMVLLDRMRDLARLKLAYPIALVLMAAHIALSQAEPVKHAFARSGPDGICVWSGAYMPAMPLPFCKGTRPR